MEFKLEGTAEEALQQINESIMLNLSKVMGEHFLRLE